MSVTIDNISIFAAKDVSVVDQVHIRVCADDAGGSEPGTLLGEVTVDGKLDTDPYPQLTDLASLSSTVVIPGATTFWVELSRTGALDALHPYGHVLSEPVVGTADGYWWFDGSIWNHSPGSGVEQLGAYIQFAGGGSWPFVDSGVHVAFGSPGVQKIAGKFTTHADPPPPPPPTDLKPGYRIRIDWGGGGPANIWVDPFESELADITADVKAGRIQRKLDQTSHVCTGELDLIMNDSWPGKYNSKNPGSPLAGLILPGAGCFVDTSFDGGATWNQIYGGWLIETESAPDYGSNEARFHFSDSAYLDRPLAAIPSTGEITVAEALVLIHAAMGWTGGTDFRSNYRLADFSTDGTGTGRGAIASLATADLGAYYVSRDFVATYVDAYEYARGTPGVTVVPSGLAVPGVSIATIKNTASAQKTGGPVQTYTDAASDAQFGPLADQQINSAWFFEDRNALGNAQWRVITQKDPTSPYWTFQPTPADPATLEGTILTDILDQVSVEPVGLPAEVQETVWVIHDFAGGSAHIVSWRLRDLPKVRPLLVGVGLIGDPDYVIVPG